MDICKKCPKSIFANNFFQKTLTEIKLVGSHFLLIPEIRALWSIFTYK